MAQISIQSEIFLSLYGKARPALERLEQQRQGFGRTVSTTMEPFSARNVLNTLDEIAELAKQGIALAGPEASQVVLDGNEIRMVGWGQSQVKASD